MKPMTRRAVLLFAFALLVSACSLKYAPPSEPVVPPARLGGIPDRAALLFSTPTQGAAVADRQPLIVLYDDHTWDYAQTTPDATETPAPSATAEVWPTFPGEPPINTPAPTATAQLSPTPPQPLWVCPTGGYVNVRAGASTSTAILGRLMAEQPGQPGQRALVKTIWYSVWAQVAYKGQTGYVHLDFADYCTSGVIQ